LKNVSKTSWEKLTEAVEMCGETTLAETMKKTKTGGANKESK